MQKTQGCAELSVESSPKSPRLVGPQVFHVIPQEIQRKSKMLFKAACKCKSCCICWPHTILEESTSSGKFWPTCKDIISIVCRGKFIKVILLLDRSFISVFACKCMWIVWLPIFYLDLRPLQTQMAIVFWKIKHDSSSFMEEMSPLFFRKSHFPISRVKWSRVR